MFTKTNDSSGFKEAETIIGPSVKIKGDFNCQGNIIVEGIVEGNIKTDNDLYVGEKAVITADVKAKNAKISGKIVGNIKIENYLEITSTANILGDVEIGNLSISKGAFLNGKCTMIKNDNNKNISTKEKTEK